MMMMNCFRRYWWGIEEESLELVAPPQEDSELVKIDGYVELLSGCRDHETSADVSDVGDFHLVKLANDAPEKIAGGAMTNAFLATIQKRNDNWAQVLSDMKYILKQKGYKQIPQFSASRKLDPKTTKFHNNTNYYSKALLIGINYTGEQEQLLGCHNDVRQMQQFLLNNNNNLDLKILMDDQSSISPTKDNILQAIEWLVEEKTTQQQQHLFFHFSGHGSFVSDFKNDQDVEADGFDEAIVPLDFQQAGIIRDDILFQQLVMKIKPTQTLTCIIDACHSGTVLDLPFATNNNKTKTNKKSYWYN